MGNPVALPSFQRLQQLRKAAGHAQKGRILAVGKACKKLYITMTYSRPERRNLW